MLLAAANQLMPFLRWLPPERAHALALRALDWVSSDSRPATTDPLLETSVLNLRFHNPIGLAAGFDKNAIATRGLAALGFGFIEVGSVTPRPQPGNARPRLFRLAGDAAIINRMGMNNAGLSVFVDRLASARSATTDGVRIGANIGINKDGADPERDYPAMVAALAPCVDYITINVSSPNTPGLRDLQAADRLLRIAAAIGGAVPKHPPLLVKLAPDLDDSALAEVVEASVEGGVSGLVLSNTTIRRPAGLRSPHSGEIGGLSGRPLFAIATRQLARAFLLARGRLLLVGVGGIASAEDAWVKMRAGATLVQLYTAFALQGPGLIPRLVEGVAAKGRAAGLKRLQDMVGVDAERLAEDGAWNT